MLEKRGSGNLEGERLAQQGVENPYDKFHGRIAPFMRARSKLAKSGDVSLYNPSTSEVAQRALRESSQDLNEGDRKNNALTNALGTKEQRDRVRGIFSKLT
jgi:hypothetical protein